VVRRELPNGSGLLAAENHVSETTVIAGMLVGGAVFDPRGREGLADLTASVAQRATTTRSYEQIYDQLDSLGASLSMGGSAHTISFRAKCISRHWPAVAGVLVELLRRPSFPQDELERARGQLLTTLRELDDSTRVVAGRELGHLVYPEGHPFRCPPFGYHATVEAIGRDEVVACHQRLFRPDTFVLTIVGNIEAEAALDTLGELVADWEPPGEPLAELDLSASHPPEAQRVVVPMAEKSQADIALGFKSIPRTHPDFYALDQATQIVGGMGLMGRLGDNVRDQQGLAYYIFARMSESFGEAIWSVRAGVNPANVEPAITSTLDEIRRIQDEPVTDQELADVQSYLVGVLPIRLETNDGVAGVLNSIELFGLGHDYVERYPDIVRSVTRDDIQRAAQAHLTAECYSLAIAGSLEP